VEIEGANKAKKKSKAPALTIHKVVNMMEVEVNKLSPMEIKAMNKLYKDTFKPLYKWGKKPFADKQGKLLCVHYKYLHKALVGKLVH